jgi:hypothetical protein
MIDFPAPRRETRFFARAAVELFCSNVETSSVSTSMSLGKEPLLPSEAEAR